MKPRDVTRDNRIFYIFIGLLLFSSIFYIYNEITKGNIGMLNFLKKAGLALAVMIALLLVLFIPYEKIFKGKGDSQNQAVLESFFSKGIEVFSTEEKEKTKAKKKRGVREGISTFFQVSLIIFLLMLVINEFKQVTFVNLNYVFFIVALLGVISFLLPPEEKKAETEKPAKASYGVIVLISIIGALFIYSKLKSMGWVAVVISITAGVLVLLFSFISFEEEAQESAKKGKPEIVFEKVNGQYRIVERGKA